MKKELLIAISIGLIVGLIIAVGMYRARKAVQEKNTPEITTLLPDRLETFSPPPSSMPSEALPALLKLTEPDDEHLAKEASLRFSGQTTPTTPVVVLHNESETVGLSDSQGNFSFPVQMDAGANIAVIRALHPEKRSSEIIRSIVYSTLTASASAVVTASPTPQEKRAPIASDEAAINSEIKQMVDRAIADPAVGGTKSKISNGFGLIGFIEKIVGSTVQIRTVTQKNRIVEIAPNTVLLKQQKTLTKDEIELNSPAILSGDTNPDGVYSGKRLILLTEDFPSPQNRRTIAGQFVQSTTKNLTLIPVSGESNTPEAMTLTSKTQWFDPLKKPLKRTEIQKGDLLIVVSSGTDEKTVLRVYSLSAKAKLSLLPTQ